MFLEGGVYEYTSEGVSITIGSGVSYPFFYSVSEITSKVQLSGGNMAVVTTIVETSSHISKMVHEMQKERGMTAGYLGSQGAQFGSEIKGQRRTTERRSVSLKGTWRRLSQSSLKRC